MHKPPLLFFYSRHRNSCFCWEQKLKILITNEKWIKFSRFSFSGEKWFNKLFIRRFPQLFLWWQRRRSHGSFHMMMKSFYKNLNEIQSSWVLNVESECLIANCDAENPQRFAVSMMLIYIKGSSKQTYIKSHPDGTLFMWRVECVEMIEVFIKNLNFHFMFALFCYSFCRSDFEKLLKSSRKMLLKSEKSITSQIAFRCYPSHRIIVGMRDHFSSWISDV